MIIKEYRRIEVFLDIIAILVILIPLASRNLYSNWIKILWFVKLYSVNKIRDIKEIIVHLTGLGKS